MYYHKTSTSSPAEQKLKRGPASPAAQVDRLIRPNAKNESVTPSYCHFPIFPLLVFFTWKLPRMHANKINRPFFHRLPFGKRPRVNTDP
ncbi:MAG: hypothetical protein CW342_06240 [Thermoactinomycetaceae bacterium]|nr:hypothetical protein [Bacillota bacterium]MBO2532481.1 hypothetical protein [Thermoactinomycetaceae bacterium]